MKFKVNYFYKYYNRMSFLQILSKLKFLLTDLGSVIPLWSSCIFNSFLRLINVFFLFRFPSLTPRLFLVFIYLFKSQERDNKSDILFISVELSISNYLTFKF